jgi:hypothetical protein
MSEKVEEKKATCETCPYYSAEHPVALVADALGGWVVSPNYGHGCCMYDNPTVQVTLYNGASQLVMVWPAVRHVDFCHNHPAVKVMESSYMLGPMAKLMTNAMEDSFNALRGGSDNP